MIYFWVAYLIIAVTLFTIVLFSHKKYSEPFYVKDLIGSILITAFWGVLLPVYITFRNRADIGEILNKRIF